MEFINEIVYTPIGYTTDQSIIDNINTRYENIFHSWIDENKTDLQHGSMLVSEFFETISPASGQVILGDGKTTLPILGVGTVKCQIGSNIVNIPDVRYIPGLSESVYSLLIHIKTP